MMGWSAKSATAGMARLLVFEFAEQAAGDELTWLMCQL